MGSLRSPMPFIALDLRNEGFHEERCVTTAGLGLGGLDTGVSWQEGVRDPGDGVILTLIPHGA